MLKTIRNRKWTLAGIAALIWLLICLLVTPVYTTVTLTFAEDPSGEVITTVFAGPGENVTAADARSRVINSGVARISWLDLKYGNHCSLKRIDPVDQAYDAGTLTIEKLTVRKNGLSVITLEGEELLRYFTGNEQVEFQDTGDFTFSVTGEDPHGRISIPLYPGKRGSVSDRLAWFRPPYRTFSPACALGTPSGPGWFALCEDYLYPVSGGCAGSSVHGCIYRASQPVLAES